jgi:glycosyltransferase involved in cell wall biosynthesis
VVDVDLGLEYSGDIGSTAIVIPCFNEADRLRVPALAAAIEARLEWSFVFVDDGSTDATSELLEGLRDSGPQRVEIMRLASNAGKGEAVRRGMRKALDGGAELVAYTDADLSTPFDELARLIDRLRRDGSLTAVLGSRFRRLGADIRRSELRHYLGRIYATLASLALRVGIYDTQCGAKAFRATPRLEQALADPFEERWAFDVELLSRLTRGRGADAWSSIVEEPLLVWHAVGGSKLGSGQAARAAAELVRIGRRHRRADSV